MTRMLSLRNVPGLLSALLLLFSFEYLLQRSIFYRSSEIDFRYIWAAGKLWALGIDPYSSKYTTLGRTMFPAGNKIGAWVYPPQWQVICRPLAMFPVGKALTIWRAINAFLLVGAASALALALGRVRPATPRWAIILLIALMALMENGPVTLSLGQTSILIFAGFCFMGAALLTGRPVPMAVAIVLLLLKPQFAVPALLCLAPAKKWRGAVLIALAVTFVASLPQVLEFGLLPTIRGLLGNMAQYGQLSSNTPVNMTGFGHLVWRATGTSLPNATGLILDAIFSMGFGILYWLRSEPEGEDASALGIGLIASAMFFLPLHGYDSIALGPIAMLAVMLRGIPRILAGAAFALALHPGIISAQFGAHDTGEQLLLSIAGLLALIAALLVALPRRGMKSGGGAL